MPSNKAESVSQELVAAIPRENEAPCPDCTLGLFVRPAEIAALGKEVAINPIVTAALEKGRMELAFDGKGPINSNFPVLSNERIMAKCLLTRAAGGCLQYAPGALNE